jgi:SAM-dependent methyltransferase
LNRSAIWHDVECGGYAADLDVWERLAAGAGGPVLELGCGTGRVSLHLARRREDVWGLDADPSLLESLRAKAAREGLAVETVCADARGFELEREFGLIIAPMQLLQVLGGGTARVAAVRSAAAHLAARGRLAAAIVEPRDAARAESIVALPDVRELDGWVYSSLPVAVDTTGGRLEICRLRQAVAPDGRLHAEEHRDLLDALSAEEAEAEAVAAGLRPTERIEVPSAGGYGGSTVVVSERP